MRRLALACAVLLAAGACTAISSYRYRALETAHLDCGYCHAEDDDLSELKMPLEALCAACHADRASGGAEHRTGMPPGPMRMMLPLSGGMVQCITCHDPHGASGHAALLRMPAQELCQACHDM